MNINTKRSYRLDGQNLYEPENCRSQVSDFTTIIKLFYYFSFESGRQSQSTVMEIEGREMENIVGVQDLSSLLQIYLINDGLV